MVGTRYREVLELQLHEWLYELERIQQLCDRSLPQTRPFVAETVAALREELAALHELAPMASSTHEIDAAWRRFALRIDECWRLLGFTA